jgi:hypothetical protein
MADFNQSPSGQAPLSLPIANLSLVATGNGLVIFPALLPSSHVGATAAIDLSPPAAAVPDPFDVYPAYRRPLRLITNTPTA